MSFDLSQLRFTVNTDSLDDAITKVGALATAVVALNKPLSKLGSDSKTTAKEIDTTTKAVDDNSTAVKKNQTILERQEAILENQVKGWSRGQASILAAGAAAGHTDKELVRLGQTLASQRKIMGNEPFDKSSSGLLGLEKGLAEAREGYRQMIKYQEEFRRLQKEGNGDELRLVALNKKETDSLYRDKQRMIEQYKLLRSASFDASNTEMLDKQKNAYKDLVTNVKNLETSYKKAATAKRPLDNLRTVDATKRRDELNYLARATSVQLGDVGISLAGGQNPLTVFLQQGDQLRGIFNQVGASSAEMSAALSKAFSQIVVGFKEVALVMGKFVVGAFIDSSKAAAGFAMQLTGVTPLINLMGAGIENLALGLGNLFPRLDMTAEKAKLAGDKFKTMMTSIATPVVATGILLIITSLVALGIAYKNILATSGELSNALILNGAALAITKKEAMDMSAAMASGTSTSLGFAKVITEVAQAGNIGKESLLGIASTAIEMNRYLGISTKDVVAAYSKLADDPVKALTEIGIATGRVNASTIERVNGLIEEGDKVGAVALATKELMRAHSEMSQKAREEMTPLGKLWDDMKFSINLLIEGVYKFANSASVVTTLTGVWQTFAATVNGVVRLINDALTLSKAVNSIKMNPLDVGNIIDQTKAELSQNLKNFRETKEAIYNPEVAHAKARSEAASKLTTQEKLYVNVLKDGVNTRREATKSEIDAFSTEKKAIEARKEVLDIEKQYGNVSNMNAAQREKAKDKEIARTKRAFEELGKGQGQDAVKLKQREMDAIAKIEENFKPKKEAKAKKPQEITDMEKAIKFMDDMLERSAGNLPTYTEDLAKLNLALKSGKYGIVEYMMAKDALEARQPAAIKAAKESEAITQANTKALDDFIEKLHKAANALEELNKKYAQQQGAGLLDNADRKAELDFRESLIGKSAKEKEMMQILFDEKSRRQKIDRKEIEDLQAAQEEYNKIVRDNPSLKESSKVGLAATQAGISSVASGARENSVKEKDIKILEVQIQVSGLDQIASAFDSMGTIMSGFSNQANSELETLKATISRTGSQYASMFKDRLKAAEESAGGLKRMTTALGGFSNAAKKLSENDKKNAKGSDEHFKGQISGYADMAGAAASYFDESSEGYKILMAVEQGFRAFEMASSLAAMAQKATETAANIAQNVAGTGPAVVKGMAEMFAQGGFAGFVGVAAMLAVMAGAGFSGSGGGGGGGTLGAGKSIGTDGRSSKAGAGEDMNQGSNYNAATGTYNLQNKPQLTDAEVKARADAAAIDAAANAVANLRIESMKLTKGSEELEKSLARARHAAGGSGRAAYELATQGMSEAERASYNYNQALMGQMSVQMDIANGTESTSENMKKLAEESRSLAIELMMASGDIAGARAMQREDDTAGYTAAEVAMYDHNQAMRDQVEAANAGASAAREAAQAEEDLANRRYELAGRLNILLGRQTQLEYDRVTELATTTDAASLEMLNLIYMMEDLTAAVDNQYATLERSIAAERKLAEVRLTSATALQSVLKSAKEATTVAMLRGNAQTSLVNLLAIAKSTGVLPTTDAMKPILDALTAPSEDLFSTFEDYQRDFLKTAYNIKEMSNLADDQVSLEQKTIDKLDAQLTAAKEQLDALKGVDNSVKDVATAIKDFDEAMRALGAAKSSTGNYNYAAPVTGGSGGGGGYGGGGGSSGASAPLFENIEGQENKSIVAAYREYYNRNPDPSGYEHFVKSLLTGDKLMQAILGASAGNPEGADYKTAVSKGYNPLDPLAKFLKSTATTTTAVNVDDFGSYAIGSNYIPNDQIAQIHKGERILPAADNRELFARLQSPDDNARVLSQALKELRVEVMELRKSSDKGNENTKRTADTLQGQQGVPFLVEIAQ